MMNKRSILTIFVSFVATLGLVEYALSQLNFSAEYLVTQDRPWARWQSISPVDLSPKDISLNQDGLRTSYSRFSASNAERPSVLVFGDSMSFGWGVNDAETFVDKTDKLFSAPIINASKLGKEPEFYSLWIDKYLEWYESKTVIVFVFANDLVGSSTDAKWRANTAEHHSRSEWKAPLFPSTTVLVAQLISLLETSSLPTVPAKATRYSLEKLFVKAEWPSSEINRFKATFGVKHLKALYENRYIGTSLLLGFKTPRFWWNSLEISGNQSEVRFDNLVSSLLYMQSVSQLRGASIKVVYLPTPWEYSKEMHRDEFALFNLEISDKWLTETPPLVARLRKNLDESAVAFVDWTEHFREHPDPESLHFQLGDVHLTEAGNDFVSRLLRDELRLIGVQ